MSTHNHIDILDESLKILFLESSDTDLDAEKEISMILSGPSVVEMSDTMHAKLMGQLHNALVQLSLGQLLKETISVKKMEVGLLSDQTGVPVGVLKELEEDAVFTNNVPIVLLQKLFSVLNISFTSAEKAIRQTFQLLQDRLGTATAVNGIAPAYKKGGFTSRESYIKNMPKNSGKDLFQNEEALNRYLSRLNELMND